MSTRPSRNAPPPPPAANALYCHTCGRIITPRKPNPSTTPSTPQKYCSDRCRRSKPRPDTNAPGTSLEKRIESTFVRLLGVGDGSEKRIVECREVEKEVFSGRDGAGGSIEDEEMKADVDVGNEDDDDDEDGGVPLPSSSSSTATSTTAATPTAQGKSLSSQQRGVRKAKEREMVRQAGRRGVAFGFEIEGEGARRKVDCVRGGRVVESSFAKGEWGVKWRG